MVLDISIEAMDNSSDNSQSHRYQAYTVHVDDHRILTVVTFSDQILSKWLNDLLKATKNSNNNHPLLVAVSAECESKRGLRDGPYDILILCVASHCIMYHLPEGEAAPKSLRAFFENRRVVAVGMEMEAVARKLEREHGIAMKNAVDVRGLAVEGLKKEGEHLDLWRYDLDKLAKTVLGKHVDVVRPLHKVDWYCFDYSHYYWWWERELTLDKVQLVTVDSYLFFLLGSHLHRKINDSSDSKKKKMIKRE